MGPSVFMKGPPPAQSWGRWCLLGPCTAGAVGNDSCLSLRTLICYCSRAAVQHAAESRWQPGRSGGRWGGGGHERVAYVAGCGGWGEGAGRTDDGWMRLCWGEVP